MREPSRTHTHTLTQQLKPSSSSFKWFVVYFNFDIRARGCSTSQLWTPASPATAIAFAAHERKSTSLRVTMEIRRGDARAVCVYDTILCYVFIGNFTSFRLLVGGIQSFCAANSIALTQNRPDCLPITRSLSLQCKSDCNNRRIQIGLDVCASSPSRCLFAGVGVSNPSVCQSSKRALLCGLYFHWEVNDLRCVCQSCATAARSVLFCRGESKKPRFVSVVAVCPEHTQANRTDKNVTTKSHFIGSKAIDTRRPMPGPLSMPFFSSFL